MKVIVVRFRPCSYEAVQTLLKELPEGEDSSLRKKGLRFFSCSCGIQSYLEEVRIHWMNYIMLNETS